MPGGRVIKAESKKTVKKGTKEFQLFSNINLAFNLTLPHLVMLFYGSLIKSQGWEKVDDVL